LDQAVIPELVWQPDIAVFVVVALLASCGHVGEIDDEFLLHKQVEGVVVLCGGKGTLAVV